MKCYSGFILVLLLTSLLWIPSGLKADIAPLQVVGGTAAAKSYHDTIRMDTEEVTIRLEKASYTVDAVFSFSNSGETATEWVGFPKGDDRSVSASNQRPFFPSGRNEFPDFIQFHAWVDGKKVPFSDEDKRWMAAQVTFAGNSTTTIRVVYEASYYRGSLAQYIVGTGSYWKDSIGKAAFTVEGSAIGGAKRFSAKLDAFKSHRLVTDNAVRIEVKDYEPKPEATLQIQVNRSGDRPRTLPTP